MDKETVYLTDNPFALAQLAYNTLAEFNVIEEIETIFMGRASDGKKMDSLSLGMAALYSKYPILDCYNTSDSQNEGVLFTKLNDINHYYNAHLEFINGFVSGDFITIADFVITRCAINIRKFPTVFTVQDSLSADGVQIHEISSMSAYTAILTYLEWYCKAFNASEALGLDMVFNRLINFDRFFEEFCAYVPFNN